MYKDQNTILAIDVGNTNLHWCLISSGKIIGEFHRNKHTELSLLPWSEVKKQNYPVIIAGSLIHMNEAVQTIAEEYSIRSVEIDVTKQNIIKNTYPTLGIDRVCNLISALNLFQISSLKLTSPVIVFDFGTATTVSSCDEKGNFLGGIIRTGCETELKAISSKTLSLPHVELAKEQKIHKLNLLARNTEDAILNGVIFGQIALVKEYINSFKKEVHPNPKIIFTGGNSTIVSRFLPEAHDIIDPYLTIKGIYYCFESLINKPILV